MEVIVLKHIGNDSWDRPVYESPDRKMFKDVSPVKGKKPELCTSDRFNGEPDTPIEYIKRYKDTVMVLTPKRITWY